VTHIWHFGHDSYLYRRYYDMHKSFSFVREYV
jgi:hypothetical protein